MKIEQIIISSEDTCFKDSDLSIQPTLFFIFGVSNLLQSTSIILQIKNIYPAALLFGCSSAGEIGGVEVRDQSMIITAICFQ